MKTIRPVEYEYKGSIKRFDLVESDEQITTICEVVEDDEGKILDIKVVSEGMTYDELCECFPPDANSKRAGMDFCLLDIMRAVIWESARNEGASLERGNVRHFWYTHVKFLVEDVLRLGETSSVAGALNTAWENLVVSGLTTYEDMNMFSAKENVRKSFIRDSPFSNLFIAVEKENLFEVFEWIPQLFNCTLVTAGGQPSRAVSRNHARELVRGLKENGTDINQDIYMCTISDLDPAGYYIQDAFRNQIEKALEYYGSDSKVKIVRLFVRPEQITENLLKHKAMKCEDVGATNEKSKKAEDTKWQYFCEQTRTKNNPAGGLYKIGDDGKKYRAKMELDAFPMEIIERNILDMLLEIIKKTSDESLITIPEIMRVFSNVKKEVVEAIYQRHKEDWLKPLIEEFLSQTNDLEKWFNDQTEEEKDDEKSRWHELVDPIHEKFDEKRTKSEEQADGEEEIEQEVIDAYKEKKGHDVRLDEIAEEIRKLEEERENIDKDIHEACEEQFNNIDFAWEQHNERVEAFNEKEAEEVKPFDKEHDEKMNEIGSRGEYRIEQLEEFRRWKTTEFNPVDIQLKEAVEEALNNPDLDFRYRMVEEDKRTRPHIAKLMRQPKLLLKDEVSAWEQSDFPVFTEEHCLEKAAINKDRTIEPHRKGFTPDFLDAMKEILHEAGDEVEVSYPEPPEMDDFKDEVKELKKKVEAEIKDGKHLEEDTEEESEEEAEEEKSDE